MPKRLGKGLFIQWTIASNFICNNWPFAFGCWENSHTFGVERVLQGTKICPLSWRMPCHDKSHENSVPPHSLSEWVNHWGTLPRIKCSLCSAQACFATTQSAALPGNCAAMCGIARAGNGRVLAGGNYVNCRAFFLPVAQAGGTCEPIYPASGCVPPVWTLPTCTSYQQSMTCSQILHGFKFFKK